MVTQALGVYAPAADRFRGKTGRLFTETTREELSQYNSDFKVPVLIDGDLIVWDSLAILEYLSDLYNRVTRHDCGSCPLLKPSAVDRRP